MMSTHRDPPTWYALTKLHPPIMRGDSIRRPHLEETLRSFVSTLPLTLVSAPAGFGKTTLLSALPLLLPDHPLAWITLETEDNDPIRFISLLATSLQRLHPECASAVWPLIAGGEMTQTVMKHAVSILLNDIRQYLPRPLILVLDDLHFVTEPLVHAAVGYLLEQLPPNLHTVISTRHDPPLRLARLAFRGQLGELRSADLGFSPQEADQLLNDTLKLKLSSQEVSALQKRTEGWPSILCLLAGPLGRMEDPENRAHLMEAMAKTDWQVLDYLSEEILTYLAPDVRLFLLQTAILAEMTPALCQAVTGRDDAAQVLEGLYKHNLAIASLNSDMGGEPVYRCHALFSRLLRMRMEREMSRQEIIELHRRAAQAQTIPGRAISHYLAAGLWDQAAQLMVASGMQLLYRGMAETVRKWYSGLPEEIRSCQTYLHILLARCEIHRGEYAAAGLLLDQARQTFLDAGDTKGEGDALTSLITLCYHFNDRESAARHVSRALSLPLSPMGQMASQLAQAWLSMCASDWDAACAYLRAGLAIPYVTGDRRADLIGVTYITAPMLAMTACMPAIERYCGEVVANALPDTAWSLGAQEWGAWALLIRGKTGEALKKAESAADLRRRLGGFPFVGNDLPVLLSVLCLAREDRVQAGLSADRLLDMTSKDTIGSKGMAMFYFHAAGRALAMLGRFDEAAVMVQKLDSINDSQPLTGYLLCHLQALIALMTGRAQEAEPALDKAVQLEDLLPIAHVGGSARLLQARLLLDQGKPDSACAAARPVISRWMIASTPGYILLDGPVIKPVLSLLARRRDACAAMMLQLFSSGIPTADAPAPDQAQKPQPAQAPAALLTPRERDVLKLLVAGRSNLQISAELFISNETVKSHVAHLLRKLDVATRAQAAIRARELGF